MVIFAFARCTFRTFKEVATFLPKMLAHPCRPVVTLHGVALPLVTQQAGAL